MSTSIYRGISVFSGAPVEITMENSKITAVHATEGAAGLPFIAPGFLDIQINGYAGVDYSGNELALEAISRLCKSLAGTGTTRHFPTIITNPYERIITVFRRCGIPP
jgi:N-acetylglucosamine-6-phosphate deacetylase